MYYVAPRQHPAAAPHPAPRARRQPLRRGAVRDGGLHRPQLAALPPDAADPDAPDRAGPPDPARGRRRRAPSPSPDEDRRRAGRRATSITGRVPLYFNSDVVFGVVRPAEPMPAGHVLSQRRSPTRCSSSTRAAASATRSSGRCATAPATTSCCRSGRPGGSTRTPAPSSGCCTSRRRRRSSRRSAIATTTASCSSTRRTPSATSTPRRGRAPRDGRRRLRDPRPLDRPDHGLPLPPPPVRRRRLGRLPLAVPLQHRRLPADHRPRPPAAAGPPDVPGAQLRRLLVRAAQVRLPPAGDPGAVQPLEHQQRRGHLLRRRQLHEPARGGDRLVHAPSGGDRARAASGHGRGVDRQGGDRGAGGHGRHVPSAHDHARPRWTSTTTATRTRWLPSEDDAGKPPSSRSAARRRSRTERSPDGACPLRRRNRHIVRGHRDHGAGASDRGAAGGPCHHAERSRPPALVALTGVRASWRPRGDGRRGLRRPRGHRPRWPAEHLRARLDADQPDARATRTATASRTGSGGPRPRPADEQQEYTTGDATRKSRTRTGRHARRRRGSPTPTGSGTGPTSARWFTRARRTPTATASPTRARIATGTASGTSPSRPGHPSRTAPTPTATGISDGVEVTAGTDPRDPASHPSRRRARADAARRTGLPGLPGRRTSGTSASTAGRSPSNSATMISAIGLDRGLHMDFGSYAGYGIPYQVVSASTPRSTVTFEYDDESDQVGYPIPAAPAIEGGPPTAIATSSWSTRTAAGSTSCSPRTQVDGELARRQRRDLGPALQRAAAGRLDERRCGRPADPARSRPLRRGRGRRDPPRAALHDQPDAASATSTRRATTRAASTSTSPAADGPAGPAQGLVRHGRACRRMPGSSPRRSSATG